MDTVTTSPCDTLRLVEPDLALREPFQDLAREFASHPGPAWQWTYKPALDDFSAYIARIKDHALGRNLPAGFVPCTYFWLRRADGMILGTSRLRFSLTPELEHEGGHIGYDIRPSQRCRGYGSALLALTLPKARAVGLPRVLLTCDLDNHASARIIEKNNGRLENTVISRNNHLGKSVCRYWIDLRLDTDSIPISGD